MKKLLLFLLLIHSGISISQNFEIHKVEPPNWWIDHEYDDLQLMIYGKNIDSIAVKSASNDLIINNIIFPENTNYCFIDVTINSNAFAGKKFIEISKSNQTKKLLFPLLERDSNENRHNGFSNKDVVYLIFPDRFANGDSSNDSLFNEKDEFEFGSQNGRHGGDIQGIIDKLDYLKDLGITTIWSTPLLENDMYMSYHGYAATDFYNIDPRHGTNNLYKEFVKKAHDKGIKVIYDHVANHIGINHEWIGKLPTKTWINGLPGNHLSANHDKIVYIDPYASPHSAEYANEGWFVDYMPDLNQNDPHLAKYIIQNTIWWIEFSGIDGIREDTYPYSNPQFMSTWAATILRHYPKFNIVGEVWKGEPSVIAAYQTNNYFDKKYETNLPVVTDFAFRDKIVDYLSGRWDLTAIYELLGKDFVYRDPNNLLVFFDNHDVDRGLYMAGGDLHKYKVALIITLMTRGIPQIFYGTEIGLDGGGHHGRIRAPFPGGFSDDKINAFSPDERDERQNEIFDYLQKLLHLRKEYEVLSVGKLTQFPLDNSMYVFTKSNHNSEIIVFINDADAEREISLNNYSSKKMDKFIAKNLFTNEILPDLKQSKIIIESKSINLYIIE